MNNEPSETIKLRELPKASDTTLLRNENENGRVIATNNPPKQTSENGYRKVVCVHCQRP